MLYLDRGQVRDTGVDMTAIMEAVRSAFVDRAQGRAQAPPKGAIYPQPEGFINSMPACTAQAAGIKWVSSYADNARYGIPSIHALMILNDPQTGQPLAIMDGSWITAMRTGAVTGVYAKLMSPVKRPVVAIVGCGVQGQSNLEALTVSNPPGVVRAYDVCDETCRRFVAEARQHFPHVQMEVAATPREAVEEADIVVTATAIRKEPRPVLQPQWLKAGCLGFPLDYDSYWSQEAIHACDQFWVDDQEQFAALRSHGYFQGLRVPDGELAALLGGCAQARKTGRERICVMSLGLGLTDVATAWLVYKKALARGIGQMLPA